MSYLHASVVFTSYIHHTHFGELVGAAHSRRTKLTFNLIGNIKKHCVVLCCVALRACELWFERTGRPGRAAQQRHLNFSFSCAPPRVVHPRLSGFLSRTSQTPNIRF
ncbi:hypothetical protein J5N97_021444 [Dioscorea zingiberensis]|uniref:Uncharacterized protein n=1 Tax=Dioscorea zingiberensis TaxID=325984 RepID=A0A9D5HEL7_9LILI|nr:hypothetical protein J5N97_021444 [Dioscorea zingiberensis]